MVTESLTLLQISSWHVRNCLRGEKSVTKSEAPESFKNAGIVSSASPYTPNPRKANKFHMIMVCL